MYEELKLPGTVVHRVILRHPPACGCSFWVETAPDEDAFLLFHQTQDITILRRDPPLKNSASTGACAIAFTMCVCPSSVRYCAFARVFASARAASPLCSRRVDRDWTPPHPYRRADANCLAIAALAPQNHFILMSDTRSRLERIG